MLQKGTNARLRCYLGSDRDHSSRVHFTHVPPGCPNCPGVVRSDPGRLWYGREVGGSGCRRLIASKSVLPLFWQELSSRQWVSQSAVTAQCGCQPPLVTKTTHDRTLSNSQRDGRRGWVVGGGGERERGNEHFGDPVQLWHCCSHF